MAISQPDWACFSLSEDQKRPTKVCSKGMAKYLQGENLAFGDVYPDLRQSLMAKDFPPNDISLSNYFWASENGAIKKDNWASVRETTLQSVCNLHILY